MDHLDVDNLMWLMPNDVLEEYKLHGDACIFGFTPGVKHWLQTCTHPRLEIWRRDMKLFAYRQRQQALLEQVRMTEYAHALYDGVKGSVRVRAVIHPVIKSWMETEHGSRVWKDEDAIADTQRLEPGLFVNS